MRYAPTVEESSGSTNRGRGHGPLAACLALAVFALTALCFWPAVEGEFLNYDDVVYVTANPRVQGGLSSSGLRWALTATDTAANWHPVTWAAHMLDVELFGLDAGAHHRSSVLWHALAATLLFGVLVQLVGAPWAACAAALAFALHPLRVEPVAMIADRKDLVAACFALASLAFWIAWLRGGATWRWLVSLAAFALALGSKPTVVTWPAVLWLVGRHLRAAPQVGAPSERGSGALRRFSLVPFALLSLASAVPVLAAQGSAGTLEVAGELPATTRVCVAAAALYEYALDTLFPSGLAGLAFFYPHPGVVGAPLPWLPALGGIALAAVAGLAARSLRPVWPELGQGLLWFGLLLLPTLGLFQFGLQARADRYTYLPSTGLALALAGGLARWPALRRRPTAVLGPLAVLAVLAALALGARRQLRVWRSTDSLMNHALAVTERNFMAHANLGSDLVRRGQLAEALDHFEASLAIRPAVPGLQRSAGQLALVLGQTQRAAGFLAEAARLAPDDLELRLSLAGLCMRLGEGVAAREHYAAVFAGAESDPELRLRAGQTLAWLLATGAGEGLRDGARAAEVAETCLGIRRSPRGLAVLAAARAEQGRFEAAVALMDEALRSASPAERAAFEAQRAAYEGRRPWRE